MAVDYERVMWDTIKFVQPTNMNQMDKGIKDCAEGVNKNEADITEINTKLTHRIIPITPINVIDTNAIDAYIENNIVHIRGYVRSNVAIPEGTTSFTQLFSIPSEFKPKIVGYTYSIVHCYDKFSSMLSYVSISTTNIIGIYKPSKAVAVNDVLVFDIEYRI